MNRLHLLPFAALALSTPAAAHQATTALACAAAKALVARQGAIVLDSSPTAYDRFVRDASFCAWGEVLRPAWVPTRDNPQCLIGYTCEQPIPMAPLRND